MFRRKLFEGPSRCFCEPTKHISLTASNGRRWHPRIANGWSSLAVSISSSSLSIRSLSGGGGSYSAKAPGPLTKSWERGAKLVQNTTVENKYLEHIREVHDPSQHLKTIEDELKGTIGQALGKQGRKILMYARLMDQERTKYEDLLLGKGNDGHDTNNNNNTNNSVLRESAITHNEYREECLKARWELMVHRQAAGFVVGNHKIVQEKYPIGDALPMAEAGEISEEGGSQEVTKPKQFTDQLDWWDRIGRWK